MSPLDRFRMMTSVAPFLVHSEKNSIFFSFFIQTFKTKFEGLKDRQNKKIVNTKPILYSKNICLFNDPICFSVKLLICEGRN